MSPATEVRGVYDRGGATEATSGAQTNDSPPPMNDEFHLHDSTRTALTKVTRTVRTEPTRTAHVESTPCTANGLAVLAGFAALFPLTLYALAHPVVATTTATGIVVGLLAGSLRRRLTLRSTRRRPSGSEQSSDAFGPTATRK